MSDEFGPDFLTITDEDGNDIELEFLDALEHNGIRYMAFFPAGSAEDPGGPEDEEELGIILLKAVEEDGEEFLSTLDTDEELNEVYDLFMERIFAEDDEPGD